MKTNNLITAFFFTVIYILLCTSCCRNCDEILEEATGPMEKFNIYKNQTGDPNADALQAQYKDDSSILNFYGNFDSDNIPSSIKTLTYQKVDNDTLVTFLFNPKTEKLDAAFTSVNGIREPLILKFDYPLENQNALEVSFYIYDWSVQKANLFYSTVIENKVDGLIESPYYSGKGSGIPNTQYNIGALGVAIAAVQSVSYFLGSTSAISAAVATASFAVGAFVATFIVVVAAIVVIPVLISSIAQADENVVYNESRTIPKDTPFNNPVNEQENPLKNLYQSDCRYSDLNFKASMDSFGDVVITGVTGGTKPYLYTFHTSDFQESEFFLNKYRDGIFYVGVKDANGCIKSKIQYFTKEIFNYNGTWVMTSYNNLPMGTTIIEYLEPDCPNTAIGSDTLNSFTLAISTDATTNLSSYHLTYSGVGDYINLYTIDENCKVTIEDRSGGAYSEDWTGEFNASDGTFIVEEEGEFFSINIWSPTEIELLFEEGKPNRLIRQ